MNENRISQVDIGGVLYDIYDRNAEHGDNTTNILYGTTQYWDSQTLLKSQLNTIYVYTDKFSYIDEGVPIPVCGMKIGDGNAYLIDKPFVADDVRKLLEKHISDTSAHITSADREKWNNKLNYSDPVVLDLLEFTRD